MPKQWSVPMRLEYDATVTVEAETAEEAKQKANDVQWVDAGAEGASLADWAVRGEPKEDTDG